MSYQKLYNPVFNALFSHDAPLGAGTELVKYFYPEVSPFAGFKEDYKNGFEDLYEMLPPGRKILFASPTKIDTPRGWQQMVEIAGLQFFFTGGLQPYTGSIPLIPLNTSHAEEMVELAALTKPGPFNSRTIEFGHYYGIFDNGKLVAMTGQRLHIDEYTEVSAVCTHPDHLGKGYAAALIQHQLGIILDSGQTPFLHVREDNDRAIALYERLGFVISRAMNFYFLKSNKL